MAGAIKTNLPKTQLLNQPPPADVVRAQMKRAAYMTWMQFSTRTSIHGVQYISDPRGNLVAK
jgi:hypothetical protein